MRRIFLLAIALTACSGSPVPKPLPEPAPLSRASTLTAVAATRQDIFFVRSEGGKCALASLNRASGAHRPIRDLDFCPDEIRPVGPDSLLLSTESKSLWLTQSGELLQAELRVVAAADNDHFAYVRDGQLRLHSGTGEIDLGSDAGLSHVRALPDGSAVVAISSTNDGDTLVRLSASGRKDLLPSPVAAVDSFDISPHGNEVVFSARRENYDVGIVSSDGGDPRWIGTDPSDETTVTWAPRGNKVSWVIHTFGGDVVRTVHIPTAFSLLADSGGASIRQIAWEPEAEKYVYIGSSPASSDEIVEARYGGEERKPVVPAEAVADISFDGWPEAGSTSLLAPPDNARYGHVYPLVIWAGGAPRAWSDARSAIWTLGGIGIAETSVLNKEFWDAVAKLPWADLNAVTIVSFAPVDSVSAPGTIQVTVISPDASKKETVVRDAAGTIRLRVTGAGADVVESVAARTITRQRKGPAAADAKH